MKLIPLQPRPELALYIDAFWLFESDFGLPPIDNRVIAPNGRAKIIIPVCNPLITVDGDIHREYPEGDIFFIGIWDRPVALCSRPQLTQTIGIELSPKGAYRFSTGSMLELTNQIFGFSDLYGKRGRDLQQQLGNAPDTAARLELIQAFLLARLTETRTSSLVEYSVDLITTSCGLLEVKELERKTGYSKRYLDMLFNEHLGISPKTLSTITRFQHVYKLWANTDVPEFSSAVLYDLYYDQSHFIKEFKRYTGYAPGQYAKAQNEFGKIFYRR